MPYKLLRLDEDRILVEQLKLLLSNVGRTTLSVILLTLLILWILSNDSNALALKIWVGIVWLSNLNGYRFARKHLANGIPLADARRIARTAIMLSAFDGLVWGALAWVALDPSWLTGSVMVISILTAVASGIMSTLSPVLLAFVAFVIPELLVVAAKMWMLNEPAYNALSVAAALYIAALLGQAVNGYRATRSAIELRFENFELVGQLRIETGIAESAQCKAEQANTAKSKFLAAASHDLRQPVHAQGLFLEVLSRTNLDTKQRDLVTNARAASEASSELLSALLDFSRIEAGVIQPQVQTLCLQPLLNKIENELAPLADAKNIIYRTRETSFAVRTDPMLLELILRNLMSNAIRYTDHGGVLVGCRQRGNQLVLEVWDTGIGIAAEHQREVFQEFHQLGNPERDRQKGLGLGLAIADGLARTLNHPLSLSSVLHRGSVFRLQLPIDNSVETTALAMSQSRTRLLNARLLFVDDDVIVRNGMLHLLREWGCECEAAESIEEALLLARKNPPDVIVSDYRLRGQHTGVEAIAAVRALLGYDLPALLITGDTAPERLREAQASGIPLLHKPVTPGMLYRRLLELQQESGSKTPELVANESEPIC
jgi:signal transduction histidine kinase/CheY-like chemotaxis protein